MGQRLFTDSHGIEWEVFDESDWSLGLALAFDHPLPADEPGLLFISVEGMRRLHPRPVQWRELPDSELEALCARANRLL